MLPVLLCLRRTLPPPAYPDTVLATVTLPLSLCQFESFTYPEPMSERITLIGVPRPLLCGNLDCAFGGFGIYYHSGCLRATRAALHTPRRKSALSSRKSVCMSLAYRWSEG